ncbi:glutathione S-transferase [Sulfitobacter marinus]|uniref:glutathione transferase n=1 Tax=Sulfitobacter marinus TaxID=394264 RepID=A0A1I6V038_9RHOB|nr:glutathione S-transferase family protein [Sulfitobacter marinus]SFT06986.1 glutathione S-transferase [Sulfitobacter marinus]
MAEGLTLIGYRYSVYTRIVRVALIEMGLEATYHELNPFSSAPNPKLLEYTPFGRVPVLQHDGFTLTETSAILRYLDAVGPGLSLVPTVPHQMARMAQVIAITDFYGYVPLVRQVFANAVFAPMMEEPADPIAVSDGLKAALPVLQSLDMIAAEGHQLNGIDISLADLHLAPMISYFAMARQGAAMLDGFPALQRWWQGVADRPSLLQTDPFTGP